MVRFLLDGVHRNADVDGLESLADVLGRYGGAFQRSGPCPDGDCGACAFIVDGRVSATCLIPMVHVDGSEVLSMDGLGEFGRRLREHAERGFEMQGASPCPDCFLPSLLVVSTLARHGEGPAPAEEAVREGLAGLGCCCGIHSRKVAILVEAARSALADPDRS